MRNCRLFQIAVVSLALAAPAAHAQVPAKPAAPAPEGLAALDANRDGKVTREEWRGNAPSFAMQDADGDGVLTGAELAPRAAAPEEDPAATFAKLDQDHNGSLKQAEWAGDPADFRRMDHNADGTVSRDEYLNLDRDRSRLDRLFRALDKNRDGRVSRSEWSSEKFAALDANRDGYLTKVEFSKR
jgi:Ca2+-binding EF-hand superfamily protein